MEANTSSIQEEISDTCVICLCSVTERAVASCGHASFDFVCLVGWLQLRSACPLCKAEVSTVTYGSSPELRTYHVRPVGLPPQNSHASNNTPQVRRRPHAHRRPFSPPARDISILRRRHVYRHKLYSLHVGSNSLSGYRNFTPEEFAASSELQSRARMWIRRELRVFAFLYPAPSDNSSIEGATTSSHAEFLITYIVAILRKMDIKASDGRAEDMLQEVLGRPNARLFLHELSSWLRSPYKKPQEWDRRVQYMERLPDDFDEDGRPLWRKKRARTEECDSPDASPLRRTRREADGTPQWTDPG